MYEPREEPLALLGEYLQKSKPKESNLSWKKGDTSRTGTKKERGNQVKKPQSKGLRTGDFATGPAGEGGEAIGRKEDLFAGTGKVKWKRPYEQRSRRQRKNLQ